MQSWPRGSSRGADRLRSGDWTATKLGRIESWSDRLRTRIEFVLDSAQPMYVGIGPDLLFIYNDAYEPVIGLRGATAFGRPMREVFSDIWPQLAPLFETTLAGQPQVVEEMRISTPWRPEQPEGYFSFSLVPLRSDAGDIDGILASLSETTNILRLARESESMRRLAFEGSGMGAWQWDLRSGLVRGDATYLALYGLQPSDEWFDGRTVLDLLTPASLAHAADVIAGEHEPGEVLEGEFDIGSGPAAGRWLRWRARSEQDRPWVLTGILFDITDRKRTEAESRDSQARQSFLIQLSDALRAEADPNDVGNKACQMMAAELSLDRFYLVIVDSINDTLIVTQEARGSDMLPLQGSYRGADFSGPMKEIFENTIVYDDVRSDPRLSELDRLSLAGMGAGALAAIAIRRGTEAMIWAAGAISKEPRAWTADDISLIENATERIWAAISRAQSLQELQQSEARFRQFAGASSDVLWIRNADTLAATFVSSAAKQVYGVAPESLIGDFDYWSSLIIPEDRELSLEQLQRALQGLEDVGEYRIRRPSDGMFRWVRRTAFPLRAEDGRITAVAGISSDVSEARQLADHRSVLLAELQHRVRNIMGMIRSLANRTADSASSVENYRELLEGRLLALARVQALLTRQVNTGAPLHVILEAELSAQAHAGQFELNGPQIDLSPKAVEVLTLAFHELTTNALKYGALSVRSGSVSVDWELFEKGGHTWLSVNWVENGGPRHDEPPTRVGFGSQLIKGRVPYELHGTGDLTIRPEGARCHLEFPMDGAESILETDAPTPATVYGGSLDMSDATDLSGQTVLVVEDEYFMASDLAAALSSAKADVLGPCPSEAATHKLLETERPTAAVVDLNLGGGGPRFEIARLLKEKGVPFVFLTGYDPDVIPQDMRDIMRLQKPIPLRDVVEAVARL